MNILTDRELPTPRIEVFQYLGYNGGYATTRILLWKCEIINASGHREFGGDWISEGCGTLDKKYAVRDAEKWQKRTHWPVFDLGRCEEHDGALKEHYRR